MKRIHWIFSRGPTRFGMSLGVHFLEESTMWAMFVQHARSLEYKQKAASWQRQRYLMPVRHRFH